MGELLSPNLQFVHTQEDTGQLNGLLTLQHFHSPSSVLCPMGSTPLLNQFAQLFPSPNHWLSQHLPFMNVVGVAHVNTSTSIDLPSLQEGLRPLEICRGDPAESGAGFCAEQKKCLPKSWQLGTQAADPLQPGMVGPCCLLC